MTAGILESAEVRDRVAPTAVLEHAWASHPFGEPAFDYPSLTKVTAPIERDFESYGVYGTATAEERALMRVAAVGILLFVIIGGMALSQYVIYLFAWATNF